MFSSTRLLVIASILVTVAGFTFLWFGITSQTTEVSGPSQTANPGAENVEVATNSAVVGIEGERVIVSKVVDGDTIVLKSGQTVRLLGIDTPETVDPRRPVQCFGKEASSETKKLLSGKEVILQKDVSETDKYKRLLRYIFLALGNGETLFVNDYLVREGFAKVLTYPPDVKFNEQLREAEKVARAQNKGLWGRCK